MTLPEKYSELENALLKAESILNDTEKVYTDGSKNELQSIYDKATALDKNLPASEQSKIEEVLSELNGAIDGIKEKADYSALDEAIEKAGGLTSLADTDCFDFYLVIEQDINIYIAPVTDDSKLSINEASKEELMTLTGIGKTLADRILAYKEEDGGFEYLEELMNVDGIGKSIFNKIKDKICL